MEILLQVNVGRRNSEVRLCFPSDVPELVEAAHALPGLDLRGLMTVAPHFDDPDGCARPCLASLRKLAEATLAFPSLSMGMTHDLEAAVEEGATMVRIGTALFGPRPTCEALLAPTR